MRKKYAPVTDDIKAKVVALLAEGKSQKKIGLLLNISTSSVFLIKNNKTIETYNRGKMIRATGISDKLYNDLEAISENLGYKKLTQFIKKELPSIRDKYPANLRIKKN